jgi:hypothetical protein
MKSRLLVTALLALWASTGIAQTANPAKPDRRLYEQVVLEELQQSPSVRGFVWRLARIPAVSNIQYYPDLLLTSYPPRQWLSFDMAERHYQFLLSSDYGGPHVVVVSLWRSDLPRRTPNEGR